MLSLQDEASSRDMRLAMQDLVDKMKHWDAVYQGRASIMIYMAKPLEFAGRTPTPSLMYSVVGGPAFAIKG